MYSDIEVFRDWNIEGYFYGIPTAHTERKDCKTDMHGTKDRFFLQSVVHAWRLKETPQITYYIGLGSSRVQPLLRKASTRSSPSAALFYGMQSHS